jgi:hypothetical protein
VQKLRYNREHTTQHSKSVINHRDEPPKSFTGGSKPQKVQSELRAHLVKEIASLLWSQDVCESLSDLELASREA